VVGGRDGNDRRGDRRTDDKHALRALAIFAGSVGDLNDDDRRRVLYLPDVDADLDGTSADRFRNAGIGFPTTRLYADGRHATLGHVFAQSGSDVLGLETLFPFIAEVAQVEGGITPPRRPVLLAVRGHIDASDRAPNVRWTDDPKQWWAVHSLSKGAMRLCAAIARSAAAEAP
jgi:hypothetical protein